MTGRDYKNICFVVMPFGRKTVGHTKVFMNFYRARMVDFDAIYRNVFKPAIESVSLPEGGQLVARRADEDLVAGHIAQEMFEYLEYSRMVLADISAINPNVYYELGVRHRAREIGTAIFRQVDASIPFDINQVRSLPYEYQPEDRVTDSRSLIAKVLTESLKQLRNDSPVQLAIGQQRQQATQSPQLEPLLHQAEKCLLQHNAAAAAGCYEEAIDKHDAGPLVRMKLAILYRDQGAWDRAVRQLEAVVAAMPTHGPAYRELGVALNKLYAKAPDGQRAGLRSGEAELQRAIALSATDFDAHASLGGILRRAGRFEEAEALYRAACELSMGHPYPLLNQIKLEARARGKLNIDEARHRELKRAARLRQAQVDDKPPADSPWCYFDLAEIRFYQGDYDAFATLTRQGVDASTHDWQPKTFHDALGLIADADLGALDKTRFAAVRGSLQSAS